MTALVPPTYYRAPRLTLPTSQNAGEADVVVTVGSDLSVGITYTAEASAELYAYDGDGNPLACLAYAVNRHDVERHGLLALAVQTARALFPAHLLDPLD